MAALYEISNEYAALLSEDMDPEMIADTLEGMEGEFTDKIEQILAVIKNETALSEALKAEAANLSARKKAADNRIESLKSYISTCMTTMEKTSINAGVHKITVRKPTVKAEIKNADIIPDEFKEFVTDIKIDKRHILEQLKLGVDVKGAELVTGKPGLVIK